MTYLIVAFMPYAATYCLRMNIQFISILSSLCSFVIEGFTLNDCTNAIRLLHLLRHIIRRAK